MKLEFIFNLIFFGLAGMQLENGRPCFVRFMFVVLAFALWLAVERKTFSSIERWWATRLHTSWSVSSIVIIKYSQKPWNKNHGLAMSEFDYCTVHYFMFLDISRDSRFAIAKINNCIIWYVHYGMWTVFPSSTKCPPTLSPLINNSIPQCISPPK